MSPFPLNPIAFRLDGRPIYGFSGGAPDEGESGGDSGSDDGGDTEVEKDPVKVLENTLAKVRQERKAAQDDFRPYKATLRELGIASPEQLKELLTKGNGAGASGDGKQEKVDVEAIRETERKAVRLEANREIALAKVEAKAKGLFADPDDAVSHLRKDVDDLLGRDGKPDDRAIERELTDLLAAKPHWGVGKQGDIGFDGGARRTADSKPEGGDAFLHRISREKRGIR